ncbi:putative cytochrome P450 monooxygenase [Byssothecium circinans]|uniref:Putative cytochrome P450 monooxygenase n=1 Tax=Byssothecium circinans TaxID=147558 RepID=A0A6A5U3T7_9PLEO|nr:putative cytochrome P450 monooxygenase [Byssothecium circinans]
MSNSPGPTTSFWSSLTVSPRTTIPYIFASIILTHCLLLSPLAKFPGPKLAAATGLYEFYFNFFRNSKYAFEIERLHDIYGPILRVNPYELSIRDAEFHDKIYVSASTRPTEIYNHFVDGVDFQGSHFLTIPHDLHRTRRKPLEPFFSRQGTTRFEPAIQGLAQKFARRLHALEGTGTVVRLDHAFEPTSLLEDEKFSADWYESLDTIVKSMPLFEGFPGLIRVVRWVPQALLKWMDPRSQLFNDWKDMCERHILDIKREKHTSPDVHTQPKGKRTTLLRSLVHSDLPESELATPRLVNEAQVLLGAGTIGTSRVLDLIAYYIVANPSIRLRIAEELDEVMREWPARKPTWAELEKLPYFQAVIKEGLRLSYGIMRRLPRISPKIPIQYHEWSIPAGLTQTETLTSTQTPVGMSAYMQHSDPNVFPEPSKFLPERWLHGNVTPLMNRNFVPFARGSRNCLGINLAYAEINHVLAVLFRRDGPQFRLYHTDESDVKPVHDFVVPLPRVDTEGVRIIMD